MCSNVVHFAFDYKRNLEGLHDKLIGNKIFKLTC